jgi:selenide,water dikinase
MGGETTAKGRRKAAAATGVPGPGAVSRRLLLVGGGHAHLFVLEALAAGRLPAARATLVAPGPLQAYSGMVPGYVGGRYRPEELTFDLARLARAAGVELIEGEVVRIDAQARRVELRAGGSVEYDVVSFATGSRTTGEELPGVAAHALFVKPIGRALAIVPALEAAAQRGRPRVLVAGGGAAGVELALAARARLRRLGARTEGSITVVDRGERLLAERSAAAARQAAAALERHGVAVRLGLEVAGAEAGALCLSDGGTLPADVLVWATGPAAPSLFRAAGLATDERGFLLVDDSLRSISHPDIFAAGDAATLCDHPGTPKAGVYAVRAGPILSHNLAAACAGAGGRLRAWSPQREHLALLDTGDGRAILSYGSLALTAGWAMTLKERIDRRFMRRFQEIGS